MRFTTLTFLVFFIGVYIVYWTVSGRSRLYVILLSSIIFYAAWSVAFALHFLGAVALNFVIVQRMQAVSADTDASTAQRRMRPYLWFAVTANVVNLFLFKYFYLFLTILYDVTGFTVFQAEFFNAWLAANTGYDSIILPLAISFYTFQLIAYVVDVYRGQITERTSALEFFVFILFFPQLVAGPIMRHSDFFHQLNAIKPKDEYVRRGVFLLLLGIIKKVVVADNLVGSVNAVYAAPEEYDALSNFIAPIGYCARVYCDFSGYTDVARGLGYLLGLKLPENFRAPYLASSVRDLWQRWHITLATWLRDYIYFPLGGNRTGRLRTYFNLATTFTLGGLWHGANYTFIAWGLLHGLAIATDRAVREFRGDAGKKDAAAAGPPTITSRAIVFLQGLGVFFLFYLGAIPFNAPDIGRAWTLFVQFVTFADGARSVHNDFLLGMFAVTMFFNYLQFREWKLPSVRVQYVLLTIFGFVTLVLVGRYAPGGSDYIYFQF